MANARAVRQAVSALSGSSEVAWRLFESLESAEILAVPELCDLLAQQRIHLVGISCATGNEDGTGLNVANDVGFFSRRIRQRTECLVRQLKELGKEVELTLFVENLEWVRAWGWTEQSVEDLKLEAWMQIEEAREALKAPPGEIIFWSDVEPRALERGLITHEQAFVWAGEREQSLSLHTDIRYRQTIPKLRDTSTTELRPSSQKRLASYALLGETFEVLYPEAVFLQSADARTDHMLQLRRKQPLPIVHPWR